MKNKTKAVSNAKRPFIFKPLSALLSSALLLCGCAAPQSSVPSASPSPIPSTELSTATSHAPSVAEYPLPYVFFINVGKADSALICTEEGSFLIDTGTAESAPQLFAALNVLGIDGLDGVFLSHTHKDHIGGFESLAAYLPIKQAYMGEFSLVKEGKQNPIVKASGNAGVPLSTLKAGDRLKLSETAFFDVLAPLTLNEDDDNDNSLVLRFQYNDKRVLFTGDMQFAEEQTLISEGVDLKADILKVANHGNPDASGEAFLRSVAPSLAVISTDTSVDTDSANERVLELLSSAQVALTQDCALGLGVYLQSEGALGLFYPEKPAASLMLDVSVDKKEQTAILTNKDSTAVDISRCVLLSERGGELFRFPDGTFIEPGSSVSVGAEGSALEYSFSGDASPWSVKKQDAALIYDSFGNLICRSE